MIIDLKEFMPKKIIPRQGKARPLKVLEHGNKLILKDKKCRKQVILNRFIRLTKNDFMAVGLYIAEGQKYINIDRQTHHSGEIGLSNSDLKCIILFCNLLEKLGINRKDCKIYIDLNINLKNRVTKKEIINYWLRSLNLTKDSLRPTYRVNYTGTKGNKISIRTGDYGCLNITYASVIFRSFLLHFINKIFINNLNSKNRENISLILKGFFAGDGCVDYSKKPRRKGILFCNQNPKIIRLLIKALNLLGVYSYFITDPENKKSNGKSLIVTKYRDMKIIIDYGIVGLVDHKRKKGQELIRSYKITNGRFSNHLKVC